MTEPGEWRAVEDEDDSLGFSPSTFYIDWSKIESDFYILSVGQRLHLSDAK